MHRIIIKIKQRYYNLKGIIFFSRYENVRLRNEIGKQNYKLDKLTYKLDRFFKYHELK